MDELKCAFEVEGWAVWWDRDNIPAGQQLDQIIDKVCVLVCWSWTSVASGWMIAEGAERLAQKKLLPVLLEEVRQLLRFCSYHAIDLRGWDGRNSHDDYRRLKAELQHRLSSELSTVLVPLFSFVMS